MTKFDTDLYISHLSVDCVVFGYQDKAIKVLISRPKYAPSHSALPGGYVLKSDGIERAAVRVLRERTQIENVYLEQFRVFGHENRIVGSEFKEQVKVGLRKLDPEVFDDEVIHWMTGRFVSVGFLALVDINKVSTSKGVLEESLDWIDLHEVPQLTYDHNEILTFALEYLRLNLDRKLIGFNLLPDTFTMRELQELYEAVYDRSFPMNNFQKKMLGLNVLERLEKKFTGAQNKAPYLYRFRKNQV